MSRRGGASTYSHYAPLAAAARPVATKSYPTDGYRLLPHPRAAAGYGLLPRARPRVKAATYAETRVRSFNFPRWRQRLENKELSLDLAVGVFDGPNEYAFAGNDPVNMGDPMGLDSFTMAFVDYKISVGDRKLPYLGHAGVVTARQHPQQASRLSTLYFEYGRYDAAKLGEARNRKVPDLDVGLFCSS